MINDKKAIVMGLWKQFEKELHRQKNFAHESIIFDTQTLRRNGNVPNRLKAEKRSGTFHKECVLCGSTEGVDFDHKVPVAMNGSNYPENLRSLCKDCHHQKTHYEKKYIFLFRLLTLIFLKNLEKYEKKKIAKKYLTKEKEALILNTYSKKIKGENNMITITEFTVSRTIQVTPYNPRTISFSGKVESQDNLDEEIIATIRRVDKLAGLSDDSDTIPQTPLPPPPPPVPTPAPVIQQQAASPTAQQPMTVAQPAPVAQQNVATGHPTQHPPVATPQPAPQQAVAAPQQQNVATGYHSSQIPVATPQPAPQQAVATPQPVQQQAVATPQPAPQQAVATPQPVPQQAVATPQPAPQQEQVDVALLNAITDLERWVIHGRNEAYVLAETLGNRKNDISQWTEEEKEIFRKMKAQIDDLPI